MMKKIIGLTLSTLILSGCASTDSVQENKTISFNEDINSHFNQERYPSHIVTNVYFVKKDELKLPEDKVNAIYKRDDFLKLIEGQDIKNFTQSMYFLNVNNQNSSKISATTSKRYISDLDVNESNKVNIKHDVVEYGLNLESSYKRDTGIFNFNLDLSELAEIKNVYVTKDDFIQVPSINNKSFKTNLRIKEDSVFLQSYKDQYFILAIFKHDELKLQSLESNKKDINEKEEVSTEPQVIIEKVDLEEETIEEETLF